jgi:hypothetical protein
VEACLKGLQLRKAGRQLRWARPKATGVLRHAAGRRYMREWRTSGRDLHPADSSLI